LNFEAIEKGAERLIDVEGYQDRKGRDRRRRKKPGAALMVGRGDSRKE